MASSSEDLTSDSADLGAEPVAIVGIACRVPGAADASTFWRNLEAGVESGTVLSRADLLTAGRTPDEIDDPAFVPVDYGLADYDRLDAGLFGLTKREAELIDPQHRLFLELCHSALEDAGYDPGRYAGDIGVYGGRGMEYYRWRHIYGNRAIAAVSDHMTVGIGNHADNLATLASYRLNLHGPAIGVYTACSTSLVAVHLAAEAVRAGECDMALAGGVVLELPLGRGYLYQEGNVNSIDGHCRPFDAQATGTVWGNGGGTVLLKRLSDALADGDHVHAVIRGNAINNDGSGKVGFSAPSIDGQAEVIAAALGVAGVDPRTVSYVEAHGTGTALGDPIEIAALRKAFGSLEPGERPWCAIGSVKSNIGHLSQGAGVVGLIKTVLALGHGTLPPSLHYSEPNPAIDFASSPFYVNSGLSHWSADAGPRRAGVSSFGIGGTNAHVVLEEAPPVPAPDDAGAQLLRLSARSEPAVAEAATRLAAALGDDVALAEVAHTLEVGRVEYPYRLAVTARDAASATAALGNRKSWISSQAGHPSVVFLFSGQGAQHGGMGLDAYARHPVFAEALDACAEAVRDSGLDLLAILGSDDDTLQQTAFAQPALFAVEYALSQLWQSWGVRPASLIGHSIGEYVAAAVAGVFDPADAIRLVALRGRLMQSMPPGAMLAVHRAVAELSVPSGLDVAAINGPGATVVSGPIELIEAYAADLAADEIPARKLHTSHAFHSAMMQPVLAEFEAAVAQVERHAPQLTVISNRTGQPLTAEQATSPGYWTAHLREPVRFGDCVATALRDGAVAFLEVGPGRQLAGLAQMQTLRDAIRPVPSLPGPGDKLGADETLLQAAGKLWTAGVPVGPVSSGRRRVPLPGYPYQRERYWLEPDPETAASVSAAASIPESRAADVADWFHVPTWRQLPPLPARPASGRWLVLHDSGRGSAVAEALRAAGVEVVSATPGAPADYVELIESVSPDRVVHLLSLEGTGLDAGLFGVLHAVQALASTGAAEHVPLSVVTAGTQSVTGADLASPQHAMVAGVLHSAPYDVEGLTWQHVDVDESDRGLIAELLVGEPGLVALRHGRRWVPDFAPLHLSETTAGLRDRGVYLITGGLGGIGRALAADLAARVPGVGLALVGRTPPGPAVAAELDALRALGARILVLAADVASVPDLVRVRQQLIDEFGALHGIVHAAGVAGGGITETRSTDGVAAVLRPKRAVDALEEVFADLPLDFVVLFSSISGTLGGLGEVDYAAANAYLDAYAQRATSRWTAPVRSLAWPGWRDTGMLAAALGERASEPFEHPLLQRRRGHLFYGTISPRTHWVLAEHAVAGVGLLPGTAQLDAMRAAFEAVVPSPGGDVIPELADVMFAAPLYVADDDSADITVTVTPAGSQAAMVSFSSGETVHSRGQARWVSAPEPARLDLAELRSRLVDRPELTRVETRNIRFGPHWQAARSILTSDTEELALLELPDDLTDETTQWALHPALVDLATTRWSVRDSDSGVVPMGYGQLTWRRRLPRRIWVYRVATGSSNAGGVLTTDFLIVDDDGNEVARIGEFMARQTDHLALLESQDADSPAAAPSVSAAPVPEATVDDTAWISPAEGAEAFRRALTAPEGHLIISPRPYAYLQERARRQAAQQLAEAVAGIAGVAGVGDSGDSVEAAITRVWSAVLGVDDIGPDDDFFDLGGNSLVAVQVISDIRKVTGVKLPMRSLFETPTVAGMTKMVTELAAEPVITAAPAPTGPTIPRLARPT